MTPQPLIVRADDLPQLLIVRADTGVCPYPKWYSVPLGGRRGGYLNIKKAGPRSVWNQPYD